MMYINNKWYTETEVKAYVDKLIDENAALKEENSVILHETDRLIKEKGKLIEENEKMKTLLKATEDFPDITDGWRYAGKALKLIEEGGGRND